MYGMARLGWHGSRKLESGRWQARWKDSERLKTESGFLTAVQADAFALRKANEALNVKVGLAVMRKPIREARDLFLNRRTKANTRALNERRVDEFLAALPEIKDTSHLTNHAVNKYALLLEEAGHNPGGQKHHLKIVRAFSNFCLENEWLMKNPFNKFVMPKSTFKSRRLTPEERDRMYTIDEGRNKLTDTWLNLAFRLGYSTMLRISQVWALKRSDFQSPNSLSISGIKGQASVTILLEDEAVAILQQIPIRAQHERYFSHWGSVQAMRNSVEDKARRVGLEGVRFHDVCKVSRITDLDDEGTSLGSLSHLSNTSKKTLAEHYIQPDRDKAFADYIARSKKSVPVSNLPVVASHRPATDQPQNGGLVVSSGAPTALEGTISTVENASTSPQILTD